MNELVERIIESKADEITWRQHITRYEFARDLVRNKRVLDVACGTGYGTYFLARECNVHITGVDISDEAIRHAKSSYSHPGLAYRQGDALDLDDFAGVDAIVSLETIEHLQEPESFLDKVVQILPPHGILIVSTPNRADGSLMDKPRNPYHVREWNAAEFMDLLTEYFGRVEFHDQNVYIKPLGFPGSRTFSRLLLRLVKPEVLERLGKWEVTAPRPPGVPLVQLSPRYIVAVCGEPRRPA